jgi:hypothetical protein
MKTDDIAVVHLDRPKGNKRPQWMSDVIVSNGELFAPAAAFGNENRVALMVAYDGDVPAVIHKKHVYFPLWCFAREFGDRDPEMVAAMVKLKQRLAREDPDLFEAQHGEAK